jgi:drug/metabolite transporter (DMT)-like permease
MQPPTPGAIRASIPASLDGGIAFAIGAALISGLAVYLNAFAVKQLPDAAVYTTLKNGVAAAILIAITLALGGYREARVIPRRQWGPILAVGVIGGSVPFILFFSGLAQASAPTAAFIQKTLFIWVAFLAVPFLGEKLGVATLAGLGGLLLGQALILPPAGIVWGSGETMILVATLLWAAETIVVRRLLGSVSSHLMGALRMGVGLVGLICYLAVTGKLAGVGLLTSTQWAWVLMTGVILAGYVATWFAALSRAPATVVTSVLVLGAVVTGALTAATRGTAPSPNVVAGYVLIVAAATLVVVWARAAARRVATASGRPDLAPLDSV